MVSLTSSQTGRSDEQLRVIAQLQAWNAWRTRLGVELARIYWDRTRTFELVESIGFRRGQVPYGIHAEDVWQQLINQLEFDNRLDDLFARVETEERFQDRLDELRTIKDDRPPIDPELLRPRPEPNLALVRPPPDLHAAPQIHRAMRTTDGLSLHCTKLDEVAAARRSLICRPSDQDHSASLWIMFQPQLDALDGIIADLELSGYRSWVSGQDAGTAIAEWIVDLRESFESTSEAARRAGAGVEEDRRRTWKQITTGIEGMRQANARIIQQLTRLFRRDIRANQTVLELQLLLIGTLCPLFMGWDKVEEAVSARCAAEKPWGEDFWNRLRMLNPREQGQDLPLEAAYVTGLSSETTSELSEAFRGFRRASLRFTLHRLNAANGDPPDAVKLCLRSTSLAARTELDTAKRIVRTTISELIT